MTTIKSPKKLIEVALPLDDINREAVRAALFAQIAKNLEFQQNGAVNHSGPIWYGSC